MKHPTSYFLMALALCGCGEDDEQVPMTPDASPAPDAQVEHPDAGPKIYDRVSDYPTDGCQAGSLAGMEMTGQWEFTPRDSGGATFSGVLSREGDEFGGTLDGMDAVRVEVDDDHLFLYRVLDVFGHGVVLCADNGDGSYFGHSARCNILNCELEQVDAVRIAPTRPFD